MRTIVTLALLLAAAVAGEPTTEGVGLTIYSSGQQGQGYAIVKERRKLALQPGRNAIRFTDVAAAIDPTTVAFKSLADPSGTTVLEQNFEYDLVSADKILSKFIDRPIAVELKDGKVVAGTLLSFDGAQIVLKTEDAASPIQIVARADNVRNLKFGELPGGLITRPTLVWLLDAAKGGDQLCKVAYQTGGMSWNADYTVVTAPDDRSLDLAGWVTIFNQCGAAFRDADLKLVAGDVHRAEPAAMPPGESAAAFETEEEMSGFVEKAFFEYHLYTLQRPTTLPNNSIKQLELFSPVRNAPSRKVYVYYGAGLEWTYGDTAFTDRDLGIPSNKKVDIYLEFDNKKEAGLGMPLPAGRVRVYKLDDADGSLEFVGEDAIDHTPKDEKVRLNLGSAFDIVGERKQTDFRIDTRAHWIRESFEIRLRNHKEEDVEVIVREILYRWSNWTIEKTTHDAQKQDVRTVHFPVKIPKDGESVLTYTVLYTW